MGDVVVGIIVVGIILLLVISLRLWVVTMVEDVVEDGMEEVMDGVPHLLAINMVNGGMVRVQL
jgi:hypothetical protein